MWIVFGTGVKATRVPGGARVERRCDQCGEAATFYEKEVTSTFRLYFVDVFDYQRHRVMACGCCGACYATDELGAPALRGDRDMVDSLGETASRAVHGVGGYIDRAADALEAGVASLLSGERPRSRVASASPLGPRVGAVAGLAEMRPAAEAEARSDGDEVDAPAEPAGARLRVQERKAGVRIKI